MAIALAALIAACGGSNPPWIDSFYGPDDPLLFDDSYRAKPSYFGTLDALRGR